MSSYMPREEGQWHRTDREARHPKVAAVPSDEDNDHTESAIIEANDEAEEAERHAESDDDEQGNDESAVIEPTNEEEQIEQDEDAPAAASSSSSSAPVKVKRSAKPKSSDVDSDSGSDYDDADEIESDDDSDDDQAANDDFENQIDVDLDEEIEPQYPRAVGAKSFGTRSTVKKYDSESYAGITFTGLPLNRENKHFPRHYGKLSIVGRLRIDIRDNEIDQLKKRGIKLISKKGRDMYRIIFLSMYRCMIRYAHEIERGRSNKAPKTIPDEAVNEMFHTFFMCPMGRT